MPIFKPFKAIRPPRDKAHLVASRSYISYPKNELKDKLNGNPYTFLHLINPEASLGLKPTKNTLDRFKLVKDRFDEWVKNDYFHTDEQPGFYIYRQTQPNLVFTGILGCTSVYDYEAGKIKIHEHTLTEREQVFVNYLDATEFHAEPVLLTYPDDSGIQELVDQYAETRADFDFTTTDTIRHQLWPVWDKQHIARIEQRFAAIDAFYIADGHHRSASSHKLAQQRRQENPAMEANDGANFFMSILIPESEMHIEPFHRLVTDLNGKSTEQLLQELERDFVVTLAADGQAAKPHIIHEFAMYLDKTWYDLELKKNPGADASPVEKLDPYIITERILVPILGIGDVKTDTRLTCIGGKDGFKNIEKQVNSGKFAIGFWLFPTSIQQVKEIADNNLYMPPKSTWVEPKLRSGLTVFEFGSGVKID
ncbi:MAG: DUF1015 domain-containing protein [Bacteroidota bacterium]